MAKKVELGPVDVQQALIQDGKLMVIDARARPWIYEGGEQKDANGEVSAPTNAKAAFVVNDRLFAVDGEGMCWTYNPAQSTWAKGHKLDVEAKEPEKAEGETDKVYPWIKGDIIEGGPIAAEELRIARATVAQADAKEKEHA